MVRSGKGSRLRLHPRTGRAGRSHANCMHLFIKCAVCIASIQMMECIVIWNSHSDRRVIPRHPRSYNSDGSRPGRENWVPVRLPHLLLLGLSNYRRTLIPDRAQPPAGPSLGRCGPKQVAMNFLYTSDASVPSAGPPTGSARCSVPRSIRLRSGKSASTAGRISLAVAKSTGRWREWPSSKRGRRRSRSQPAGRAQFCIGNSR
jgi:hypothetical protein